MLGLSKLLGPLLGRGYPSIGVQVKLLQDSSVIGISDELFGFWLGSELGSPLWDLLDYETWPSIGIQFIVDTPHGLKVRYPGLVGLPLWSTLAVSTSVYGPKFPPPPSGTCITSPLWATLAAPLSGAQTIIPWCSGHSWNYHKAKFNKKVEIELEGLMGLGDFVVSTF